MKKKIIILLVFATFLLTGCVDTPKDVFNNIKKNMADEFNVELVDYEARNDGKENSYTYHLKTENFDFYANSYMDPSSISGGSKRFTNISAVIYHNNINKITEIANKYELDIEEINENSDYYSDSYDYKLVINANKSQETNVSKFVQELLEMPDIKKLFNLRYPKDTDENDEESRFSSVYHEDLIEDYSSIQIYDGTKIIDYTSILGKSWESKLWKKEQK